MVLSIVAILFVGVVAFFHYTQGFFTATLSAIITVFAAVIAVSYHETVVHALIKGSFADSAHAMMLVGIFGVTYGILRILFDKAIPGNVRTPSTVDKVGAGLMGIVAGIFATGIMLVALQMLPFGPGMSFVGFSRYPTKSEDKVTVPTAGNSTYDESPVQDRLAETTFDPVKRNALWIPCDDIVMWTAYKLGDGALPGERVMESIHPDYMQELFTERLGIQTGAFRSAVQFKGIETVKIEQVFRKSSLTGYDGERPEIRGTIALPAGKVIVNPKADKAADDKKQKSDKPPTKYEVKPTRDQRLIIVRIGLTDQAAPEGEKNIFRFSCGSIRLVAKVGDHYEDFHPIGTMQGDDTVLLNAPDDFLFVNLQEKHGFDAVFLVDASTIEGEKKAVLAKETFISIKRFANLDLSGLSVSDGYKASYDHQVFRKKPLVEFLKLPEIKSPEDADAKKK